MSKRAAVVVAALAIPATAHADRLPRAVELSVVGGGAIMGDPGAIGPDRFGTLVGATLAWNHPAPDYPAIDNHATAHGDLVPEVSLIALGDRGAALAGLRMELDVAQRGMGLFHVSARMSIWLAPQVGVIDQGGSPVVGGEFGEAWYPGHSAWKIGMTMGVLGWREAGSVDTPIGGSIAFKAEPPGSKQIAITFGLVVAK